MFVLEKREEGDGFGGGFFAEEAEAGIGSDVAGRKKFPEKGGFAEEVKALFRPGYKPKFFA